MVGFGIVSISHSSEDEVGMVRHPSPTEKGHKEQDSVAQSNRRRAIFRLIFPIVTHAFQVFQAHETYKLYTQARDRYSSMAHALPGVAVGFHNAGHALSLCERWLVVCESRFSTNEQPTLA